MYTLNIKDIEVEPKIVEEKIISGNNREDVLNEAEKYIQEKYTNVYNPYTLQRKMFDLVKNDDGKTYGEEVSEKIAKEMESGDKEFKEKQDLRYKKMEEGEKIIEKKYSEQCAQLNIKWQEEVDKIAKEEERVVIDEKFETIRDGYAWEKDKALSALRKSLDEEFA